jgi:hypothetical protein
MGKNDSHFYGEALQPGFVVVTRISPSQKGTYELSIPKNG